MIGFFSFRNWLLTVLSVLILMPGLTFAQELNLSPDCSNASASPSSIWPVNHKFIDIDITGVTDPDSDPLSISVQCILQDEELNATGDGNFIYDAGGIETPTASVRSERSGNNNGRFYHIDFIATDSIGARCGGEVTVSVPHDIKNPAIDEGRLFESVPSNNICGLHDINNEPWIYSEPVLTGVTYEVYQYDVNGHDPDQDVLTYSIVSGPSGLVIDNLSGLLTWAIPEGGIFTITVRIDDNRGGSDEQVYSLNIIPKPTVTLNAGVNEIKSGESTTLTWSSTDADTLSIEPGIGTVEQSGITSVTPAETTTYTITASGRGGTATASVAITVTEASIDLVPVSPDIDDAACPDSVNLLVQLQNISEGIADAGIAVTFYNGDPQNGGTFVGTASSLDVLEPGSFETVSLQWVLPPVGAATIYIKADDTGNGAGQFDETNEDNNLVTLDVSVCEDIQDPDANSISGEVIDAVNGERLSNVVVDLHISENGEPGTVVASFRTNYEGIFIFRDLAPDTYIITGTVLGYADGERQAILIKNAVLEHQDLVLSPVLEEDNIRIILTWGQTPEDLEAHLTGPNTEGCRNHCFYWNKEIQGANLDLDDRHSFGPETITITEPTSGTYRYYVHNFTYRTNLNNYVLAYYGAEVKVYLAGQEEPLVFTPDYRYTRGTVWHVFDIDGDTGEITPVNKFTHQIEPGQIDFPRITSSPGYYPYAYWGVPYTYQIIAEDPDDDILTYTLLEGPEGMSIDSETGLLEWTPLGIPDYLNLVTVKVSDGRCGEDTQSFYIRAHSTPAASFSADPCSAYNENGDFTLTWSTAYSETVLIDQDIGEVETSGSMTIPSPEYPVVYTLTAFNDAAATIRRVPAAIPNIGISFTPSVIEPTHTSMLKWNCGCSATCEIDQGIGKVSGTGSIEVSPLETTTYTITASNAVGQRIRAATLTVRLPTPPAPPVPPVTPAPTVSFSGAPSCDWSPGIPITLSWSTANATNCEITPGVGQVNCNGSVVVNPDEFGTYTFTARGYGGVRSINFTFPPSPPYTYRRLWVTPTGYVKPGDEVTLNWSITCADIVTITGKGSDGIVDSIDEVVAVGSQLITVLDDLPYTYTLTATNERGPSSYTIGLYGLPPRGTFTTDDSVIKVGESSVLRWTSQDADNCTITPNVGEVDCNGGSVTVTPDKPSYYYLKLDGPGGRYTYSLYVNFVPPDVDIQATPETIREGESTTLSWVFSNSTSCSIDHGIGEIQLGETLDVTPLGTTTYKITAIGPGGTKTDQVTVNVIPANPPPTATITVNPGVIWNGDESILAWSSEYADSVTITPNIGIVATSGLQTISPIKDTTYTITATGGGGSATSQVRITVLQYTPTASLTATPENIELGGSSVLSWNSEHADTVTITPNVGAVAASGSIEVSPDTTTTYKMTAKGPGGTAIDFVTVSYPVPNVTFTADPAIINYPGAATLSWDSTNATSVVINPDIGTVEPSGMIDISPLVNITYTITATGPGGSVNKSVTVTVIYPQPTATFSAQPDSIAKGGLAQLTWSSEYADSCSITPDIGPVACNGTISVTPAVTTTYTFTATGPGGSISKSSTVTILDPPIINFNVDKDKVAAGEFVLLEWSVQNADTVAIEPNIGSVASVGTIEVQVSDTTTYTLTATGLGGTAEASVVVTVIPLPQIDFVANPIDIEPGASSVLSWNVSDAEMILIDQEIGDVTVLSSINVSPAETTTYTITATGIGGTATASVTVNVVYPIPTVNITATPLLIQANDSVTLTWNSTETDTVTIDQVLIPIASSGTIQVNPSETTLYTITASGRGGTVIGWVRVFVDEQGAYSYGDPTPAEQAQLEAINRTRANPEAEADRLGIDLYEGLPEGTINGVPRQPLVMNSKLLQAASLHSQDMVDNNFFDHISPTDGRSPYQRITDAGYQYQAAAENIGGRCNASLTSATDEGLALHEELFIDAGIDGRGHRLNILNNRYKEIGIGMAVGAYTGDPTCYLLTNDFAQSLVDSRSFVTGVAYEDVNEDGLYTAGEGMGNVVIDVAGEGIQTTTASAGGYGIPIDPGTYTLIASLPGGFTVSKDITIDDQNVKVDFLYNEFNVLPPTVTFTSDVYTIALNDSATLSWESLYGYNVEIDNGINSVSDSGTKIVSPDVTTIYTITVTGLEGTVTKSVTITVTDVPLPSVILRASPELIPLNGSSVLSWNSFYADSCEILPDIGQLPLPVNGSHEVSPTSTTTYTLTCTGSGGTNLDTVTVSYPTPTAQITATPAALLSGQSSDLSWQTNDATSYTINGVDTGAENGTMQVTPATSTDYTLSATGPGGTTVETVTVDVLDQQALGVGITFPADGATLSLPFTMVQGIVTPGDAEVGLRVNGVPALRDGNNFFVNALSLFEGENTITVAATSADGATTITDSITVTVDTSQTTEWLTLSMIPETGVAPFSTTLYAKLNLLERSISSSSLTHDGPGNGVITQVNPTEYDLEIDTPGIHTLSYQATDDLGSSFLQNIKVYVYDRVELSTMLQGKWNGMRASLSTGDINAALEVFSSNAKDMYSYNFNLLSDHLVEVAAGLQDIIFVDMYDDEAAFEMLGEQDGVTYSFQVVFILDGDGIWKLRFF